MRVMIANPLSDVIAQVQDQIDVLDAAGQTHLPRRK